MAVRRHSVQSMVAWWPGRWVPSTSWRTTAGRGNANDASALLVVLTVCVAIRGTGPMTRVTSLEGAERMVRVEEGRAYRYVRALFPRTASRSMNWSFSNDFGVWDASDGRVQ